MIQRQTTQLIHAAFVVAISSGLAHAQDLTPTHQTQDHPIVLVGATVHTVSDGSIEDGLVIFNNGAITYVGDREWLNYADLSPNTELIDMSGKHIYPGLIDSVTKLGLEEVSAVRATKDHNEVGPITPEVRAYVAVNPDSMVIPTARTNGVLTVGVFPTGGAIPGRVSLLNTDGWTTEDLAVVRDAGLVVSLTDSNLDNINTIFDQATAYAQHHDTIDQRLDAITTVLPSAEDQNPVFMRANSYDAITKSVEWAMSRDLKAIIVGGRDADLCTDLLVSTDTPVVIGGTFGFPERPDSPYDDPYTLPAKLQAAGVEWTLTMSSRFGHERNLPDAAAIAVAHGDEYGFTEEAALYGITLGAATILGLESSLGSIEEGKHATLIVTDGNILETTSVVTEAFIRGRSVDLSNKQTELRDLYREKYRQLGMIESSSADNED